MAIRTLSNQQKIQSIGQRVRIQTTDKSVFIGQIEAFNVDQDSVGIKDLKVEKGSIKGAKKVAAIFFDKDIERFELLLKEKTPSLPNDSNKENVQRPKESRREEFRSNTMESSNFRPDYEYSINAVAEDEDHREFQSWEPDADHPSDDRYEMGNEDTHAAGWAPEEMFNMNAKLGVQSSYVSVENYSNTHPVGDEEAYMNAEKMALEINGSDESKRNAQMENLDEERDIVDRTSDEKKTGRGSKRMFDNKKAKEPQRENRSKEKKSWRDRPDDSKNKQRPKVDVRNGEDARVPVFGNQPDNAHNVDQREFKFNATAKEFVPTSSDVPENMNVPVVHQPAPPQMYPQQMYPQQMYPQQMYPPQMYPQQMYPHMYPQYIPTVQPLVAYPNQFMPGVQPYLTAYQAPFMPPHKQYAQSPGQHIPTVQPLAYQQHPYLPQ